MFPINTPPSAPPHSVVMIAMADQAKYANSKLRKMGVCMVMSSLRPLPPLEYQGEFVVDAKDDSALYLINYEHRDASGKVSAVVLKPPMHGTLEDDGEGSFAYFPNQDYVGKDSTTIEVDHDGIKVQVIYDFRDFDRGTDTNEDDYTCGKQGRSWKIASGSSGNSDIDAFARQLLLGDAEDSSAVTVRVGNLPQGEAGEARGEGTPTPTITLSPNAAGYGWFPDGNLADIATYFLPRFRF